MRDTQAAELALATYESFSLVRSWAKGVVALESFLTSSEVNVLETTRLLAATMPTR
jgi:hypothetical protein